MTWTQHIVNKFEIPEGPWSTDDYDDDSMICDTNASLTYLVIENAVTLAVDVQKYNGTETKQEIKKSRHFKWWCSPVFMVHFQGANVSVRSNIFKNGIAYKWAVYLLLNKGADWGTPKDYAH